jgi:hypothetical protein
MAAQAAELACAADQRRQVLRVDLARAAAARAGLELEHAAPPVAALLIAEASLGLGRIGPARGIALQELLQRAVEEGRELRVDARGRPEARGRDRGQEPVGLGLLERGARDRAARAAARAPAPSSKRCGVRDEADSARASASAAKGCTPVASSYSTTPSANRSLARCRPPRAPARARGRAGCPVAAPRADRRRRKARARSPGRSAPRCPRHPGARSRA